MILDATVHGNYSDEDKKIIEKSFRRLEREVRKKNLPQHKLDLISKAYHIACKAHENDRRKSGEPYIVHPIEVAMITAKEMGLGATTIACAILHDTVEDTEITLDIIREEFSDKIALIIDGLTKISEVVDLTAGSLQAMNFRKILLTITDDIRVIIVKLADRLHNMRTMASMRRDKQIKISSETLFMYAPLAHRFGFYKIKSELEDLCLKYIEPEAYGEITQKLKDTDATRKKYIQEFIQPIKKTLDQTGLKYEINGRAKHIYSIWNKIKTKSVGFDDLYDLFAIRIILDSSFEDEKAECWRAYSVVTDFYKPNPDRLKDFISSPKANGYESLHTTVMGPKGRWVEVQIRTKRMHAIAEQGLAAHWKYKEGTPTKQDDSESTLDRWIQHVREILQNPESDAIEFINNFKSELFEDEIYTFSPAGEMFMLPNGATALDFAFHIHTEVGKQCMGAKVNHKLVPISHVLKNGDQVEIITSKKQKPNDDWLKIAITSKAKGKIRSSLKEEKKQIADDGKEMLNRKLKAMKVTADHVNYHEITNYYNLKTTLDLFYNIATKKVDLSDLKLFTVQGDRIYAPKEETKTREIKVEGNVREFLNKDADLMIMGSASSEIEYEYAKCCTPIPGDDVFGFVTIGKGVKIHRVACPNAVQLVSKYGYRVVKVSWTKTHEIAFLSGIHIRGFDDKGLVNKITNIIFNDMKLNMQSVNFTSNQGVFEGHVNIYVNDRKELDLLIQKIKGMDGILECSRI